MNTEKRIREAAVRAVLRQGYDKTTMQDIANEAGIARSTIYTKWKTKETLFTELLWVESEAYMDTWLELVEHDPEGGSLRGVYRNAVLAVRQRPFILALYAQNQFVLGSFIHDPIYEKAMSGMLLWNTKWFSTLQTYGLVRADLDVEIIAWIEVIFRQGLFSSPFNMGAHPNIDYETILDHFFTMFEQFVGTKETVPPDVGNIALKNYVDTFKRDYQQFLND